MAGCTLTIIGPRLEQAEGARASLPAPQARIRRVRPAGRDFPDMSAGFPAAPQGGRQGAAVSLAIQFVYTSSPEAFSGLTEPARRRRRPFDIPGRAAGEGPVKAAMPSVCVKEFSFSTVCQETVTGCKDC